MATFSTEPKQVPMQAHQMLPLPVTASSAVPRLTVAERALTFFIFVVAWAGAFLTCYGITALSMIKKDHPEMTLEQEKGDIVALVFGVVILVVIVPGSWYIRNTMRR